MEASGLNPASDLLSEEQLGNKERMAGIHATLMFKNNGLGEFLK